MIKSVPDESQEIIKSFIEEAKSIATAKDFDYLLAKLKGQSIDNASKGIEEEHKDDGD